jgi:cytochrome c biogenesis protein
MKEVKVAATEKDKGYDVILFDLFRSLKLTIFLLILLAILSIIGTVITQNATSEEYIQRYGVSLYEVLDFFGLFDMYHSWWFSTILLILVVNLVACSLHRFPGVWKQFFRKSGAGALEDSMVKILPYVEKVSTKPTKTNLEKGIQSQLKKGFKHQERIETESAITLYSEKGKFSRLGVYIAHLSLIIILIGGLIGSLFGFKGFINILEGETIDHIGVRVKDKVVEKPIPFSVRCDDFKVAFYDLPGKQRYVKEYTSILTVLENGKEILKSTVQVNHPLHYKGLTFYQSSYGAIHDLTLGVQWKGQKEKALLKISEGGTVPVPNSPFSIRILRYEHQVDNFGEGCQVVLFKPNQQPKAFWLIKNLPQFDQQRGDDFVLSIEEVFEREYTGLQVAKDPGVWVVWVGCALLILGLIVSFFFSHQRVWVRIPKIPGKEIVLAGSASKNRVGFEKVFQQLVDGVRKIGQK